METEKRIFVVNGEEMIGTVLNETEGFHIIGFKPYISHSAKERQVYEEYNYMMPCGKLLSPNENFCWVGNFFNGVAVVARLEDEKCNMINSDGSFVLSKDFEIIEEECTEGFWNFYDKEKEGYNYIKGDGTILIPDEYFYDAWPFKEGLAVVQKYDKLYYYVKNDGTFLNTIGFVDAEDFCDGVAEIAIKCKIDKEGNIII